MEHLARSPDCDLWFDLLERPFLFHSPFGGDDFALMLVVSDTSVTPDEQAALSVQFVREGCRYAVCAGHECSTWDTSIDLAYLASDPNYSPPDDRFVMTTWHENEPIADVVEFFRWSTAFDDFTPRNFLAILLGGCHATEVRQALAQFS